MRNAANKEQHGGDFGVVLANLHTLGVDWAIEAVFDPLWR